MASPVILIMEKALFLTNISPGNFEIVFKHNEV